MFMILKNRLVWLSAIALLTLTASSVHAVEDATNDPAKPELTSDDLESDGTKSGYTTDDSSEGPSGVVSELQQDDVKKSSVFKPTLLDGAFDPWFKFKRELNQKYGLQIGFNYNMLYLYATETDTGIDDAAGGRFQIQGMWTVLGRKGKNPGGFSFRFEDRHKVGTDIPPTKLGSQFGSATIPGTGFSDFDFALTELAWRQTALDGKVKFGFGKISATTWYNVHTLSSALSGFQNSGMRSSGAKPFPGRGLGAVGGFRVHDNFVLMAGLHDANGVTSGNPFDTIDEGEFYYSTELRWIPTTFDRRRYDNVRVQLWYQDERTDKSTPAGYGATFLASRLYQDRYLPFFLAGISDGKATYLKNDATIGMAFAFNTKNHAARDVVGMGLNWADPSDAKFDYQYTAELFYRVQLYKHLAFTPSVQYVNNPAFSPSEDAVWVAGIRGRFTF